jgi:thiamine-phosphate pyrophosphorylase
VQLRHKEMPRGELFELARRLAGRVRAAGGLFLVNDHLDIALLAGADGVHLGADDLPLMEARRLAPRPFLIGASAGSPESARAAVAAGADYIGCGPAFATPVKAGKPAIGPEGVALVAAAVAVPVFAIGGVEPANLARLVAAGVRRACVIRGLSQAPDPERAAREMKAALCA